MTDTTNDIDALFQVLAHVRGTDEHRAALTALVADRDALRERVLRREADINALADSNAILRERLEAKADSNAILRERLEANPPADRDRELRERLVESALRVAHDTMMTKSEAEKLGRQTVWIVNGALAAMRKGEQP